MSESESNKTIDLTDSPNPELVEDKLGCDQEVSPSLETDLEKTVPSADNVTEDHDGESSSNDKPEEDSKPELTETQDEVQEQGPDDVQVLARRDALFKTISAYMKLVDSQHNHPKMLQDGTISGFLVLCMGDQDPEVVERSFEVFYALSQFQENFPLLRNVNYLMDALKEVARNPLLETTVRKAAKHLLTELKLPPKPENQSQPLSEVSESIKNINIATPTTSTDGKSNVLSTDLNRTMSTMRRKNKGRETILFVDNGILQQKSERTKVTQALIRISGIISVTYDLKKNYCIVRGKRTVAQEDFARSVASLGLASVYLIRKNESKEEVKILIPADDQENVPQYPQYPEEFENEEADNSAALARKDVNPENTSFLKSAKNFIKRSFYW